MAQSNAEEANWDDVLQTDWFDDTEVKMREMRVIIRNFLLYRHPNVSNSDLSHKLDEIVGRRRPQDNEIHIWILYNWLHPAVAICAGQSRRDQRVLHVFDGLGQSYMLAARIQNSAPSQAPLVASQTVLTANLGAVPASDASLQPTVSTASTASTEPADAQRRKSGTILDRVSEESESSQGGKDRKDVENIGGQYKSREALQ